MEAFFRNDQEIREWVDLLIEKLFTVNLLSGNDADTEFYQGKKLVEKIASSFQEMVDLPQEALVDGIRQLVEQRLPDRRVIDNFPDFYRLMNEMICAGLHNKEAEIEYFPQQLSNIKDMIQNTDINNIPSSKVALKGGALKQELDSSFSLRHHLLKTMDTLGAMGSTYAAPQYIDAEKHGESQEDNMNEVVQQKDIGLDHQVLTSSEANLVKDLNYSDLISKSLHELSGESMKQLLEESHSSIDEYTSALLQRPIGTTVQAEEIISSSQPSSKNAEVIDDEVIDDEVIDDEVIKKEALKEDAIKEKVTKEEIIKEEALEESVPALSPMICRNEDEDRDFLETPSITKRRDPFRFNKSKKIQKTIAVAPAPTPAPVISTQQTTQEGKTFAKVIKQYYENESIEWNVIIEEYLFLAKVNDLLIYVIPNDSQPDNEYIKEMNNKMKKCGFKVFICFAEDLSFPRRLERGIRRLIR